MTNIHDRDRAKLLAKLDNPNELDELDWLDELWANVNDFTNRSIVRAAFEAMIARRYPWLAARIRELEEENARLQQIVGRYGDRQRMATAPAALQQTIDDAMAACLAKEKLLP